MWLLPSSFRDKSERLPIAPFVFSQILRSFPYLLYLTALTPMVGHQFNSLLTGILSCPGLSLQLSHYGYCHYQLTVGCLRSLKTRSYTLLWIAFTKTSVWRDKVKLSLFYRWVKWDSKRYTNLYEIKELISSRAMSPVTIPSFSSIHFLKKPSMVTSNCSTSQTPCTPQTILLWHYPHLWTGTAGFLGSWGQDCSFLWITYIKNVNSY